MLIHGVPGGIGGLGVQSANAAAALASVASGVHAFGPGPVPASTNGNIHWHQAPAPSSLWSPQYTWRRWYQGRAQFERDARLGRWAAAGIAQLRPRLCYTFTQVGLETLKWSRSNGVPSSLESPNGHIRNFRSVYESESDRWCRSRYRGHPAAAMVERVEEEYDLADRIRVSSQWSKDSLIARGLPPNKISVIQQPVDLERFRPAPHPPKPTGPLRICFVGSLDLRKGFVYLLRALRLLPPDAASLEIVGATGSRCCARLFTEESQELSVTSSVGDPLPAYQRAEIFVLPTLEDGSPFAVAEAMACALPVIVTSSCGSAEWVEEGRSGWVVPSRNPEAIAAVLERAIERRSELRAMGNAARKDTEERAGSSCFSSFSNWFRND